LILSGTDLEVHHLEGLTTDQSAGESLHYGKFSTDGTYVVAANKLGQIITIHNLHRNSLQPISIQFRMCALVLTGSMLLVQGVDTIVAWKLTAEGTVDGTSGIRMADCSDSLWTKPLRGG